MKSVFDASNGIEAHMINNLLRLNDIQGEVFGEHLQGGVGDLQAFGIVRVMVSDEDYIEARRVIKEWELLQPAPEKEDEKTVKKYGGFSSGMVGFILGAVLVFLLYQSSIEYNGIDYNRDGKLDEKWKYINNQLSSAEIDQNRDGEVDLIYKYDLGGLIKTSKIDFDFDGRFETQCRFKRGNTQSCRADIDGDGFNEIREAYKYGVLESISMLDPRTEIVRKKQYFEAQRLKFSSVDLNGDGELDTHYEYDEYEQMRPKE